jgi:hypothetical protein
MQNKVTYSKSRMRKEKSRLRRLRVGYVGLAVGLGQPV